MDSVQGTRALPRVGFPIRKSPDRSLFSDSPRLIAAVHVLHRLLVPRHPPCALVLLNVRRSFSREHQLPLCSFQGAHGPRARRRAPTAPPRCAVQCRPAVRSLEGRSLKAQQHGPRAGVPGGGTSRRERRPRARGLTGLDRVVDVDSRRAPCRDTTGRPHEADAGDPWGSLRWSSATASLERR
jgi:hypothetical protein